MDQDKYAFPIEAIQKPFILFGFSIVKIVLKDTENPFTQSALKCFKEEKGFVGLFELIDRFEADKVENNWTLEMREIFSFFVLNDLIVRIFRSEYYSVLKNDYEHHFDTNDRFEGISKLTVELAESILEQFQPLRTQDVFAWYLWRAERFPDPVSGISPAMAVFNHLPKIPLNPPQLRFSDFGDEIAVNYDKKGSDILYLKNMNCLMTLLFVVGDEENPPAKIITAYFPDFEEECKALMKKLSKKTRRKKIPLSYSDFGLIYAATDLYGRLIASSYRNILPLLKKRAVITLDEKDYELDSEWVRECFIPIGDNDLKNFNEEFGNFDVIKAYRAIAADMVWFDD